MSSTHNTPDTESAFAPDQARERLRQFFLSTPDSDVSRRWDDIWKEDFLPFDRGTANPALDEALGRFVVCGSSSTTTSEPDVSHVPLEQVLGSPIDKATGQRRKALVPGCGRGYDVLLLAAYGYDAIGLEISPTAVKAAEALKAGIEMVVVQGGQSGDSTSPAAQAQEHEDVIRVYRTRDPQGVGRGSARFVLGDFYGDPQAWASPSSSSSSQSSQSGGDTTTPLPSHFDLIVDYTFLCAFPPSQRPRWAATMARLLRTAAQSRLICVEFPTYKDPTVRGPPWAMPSHAYLAVLSRPGREVQYDEGKNALVSEDDAKVLQEGKPVDEDGMVRIVHYKCQRTHMAGKDTDHLGIWRRNRDA